MLQKCKFENTKFIQIRTFPVYQITEYYFILEEPHPQIYPVRAAVISVKHIRDGGHRHIDIEARSLAFFVLAQE